jgi:hypothetical protein
MDQSCMGEIEPQIRSHVTRFLQQNYPGYNVDSITIEESNNDSVHIHVENEQGIQVRITDLKPLYATCDGETYVINFSDSNQSNNSNNNQNNYNNQYRGGRRRRSRRRSRRSVRRRRNTRRSRH